MAKEGLWESISEHISLTRSTIAQHCSKILTLKGFLRPGDQFKCLEDVGEGYLEDLVNRSLILVNKKGSNGKFESIGIHDLLREICIKKAKEEGFLHHVSFEMNSWKDAEPNLNRRISIHFTKSSEECRIQDSSACSLLLFSKRNWRSRLYLSCRRLIILDAPEVTWMNFSDVISLFIDLRYIAFALNHTTCPNGFPAPLYKLPNLQTIITHKNDYRPLKIPYEIFGMPKLRHLITVIPFRLSNIAKITSIHESDLQTLETVINCSFTEELIKILVNLKRLKVDFDMENDHWDDLNLNNLFQLQKLEELEITVRQHNRLMIWKHAFPVGLKKLTLQGVPLAWENMTIIGSLPNLQVLEMMYICAPEFSEWIPMEGQFLRLKYFRCSLDNVIKWEVEKEHLPSLESLILAYATFIEEIPFGIGEIDSLQLIELWFCTKSLVNSAQRIHEQQHENGNHDFQVRVFGSTEKIYAI
ncbi:putative late blight resistance protein homolog R1A-3 [Henckelia pumila]|uniref:putative late blight resistance protein homolog R1A-3 n=1 Tax=Henckelia pumila TaxID=405737 RepID=UPI003C6E1133